jgi:hypothetical protein
MSKVKMFFVAAALLLTTVGVFAGKGKAFFSSYTVYAEHSGNYIPLTSFIPLSQSLAPGPGNQAKIAGSQSSTFYNLWGGYIVTGGVAYTQLVTIGF